MTAIVVHKNVRYRKEDAEALGLLDKAVPAPESIVPEPNTKRRRPSTRKTAKHADPGELTDAEE